VYPESKNNGLERMILVWVPDHLLQRRKRRTVFTTKALREYKNEKLDYFTVHG